MRKGIMIAEVNISKGEVIALTSTGEKIKLTRSQRNVLSDYKNPNYVNDVIKEFSNPNVFSEGFKVIKNGQVKRTY